MLSNGLLAHIAKHCYAVRMTTQRLDDKVRGALERRRGEWPLIARQADVSHSWLSKFVRREIGNPGYATLVRLDECLSAADQAPQTAVANS